MIIFSASQFVSRFSVVSLNKILSYYNFKRQNPDATTWESD